MRVSTQWRVSMSGYTSLDYTAVRHACELLGRKVSPEEFEGLTVMERAALSTWARGREA